MYKKIILLAAVIISALWLNLIASNAVMGQEIVSDEVINSGTVGAPLVTPTPTPLEIPVCSSTEHLDASGTKCVSWSESFPPAPPYAVFPRYPEERIPKEGIKFSIFGYGPAGSEIKMTAIGVFETTQIDENGYFEFVNPPFPTFLSYLMGNYYPELCFQAEDIKNRLSMPVCIAPLTQKAFTKEVGPVVLPPTISVSSGVSVKESRLVASGSTFPNSDMEIYVAKKSKNNFLKLVKEVSAFYLPVYNVRSDEYGNYEFSLPTNVSDEWKIFAASSFQGHQSPKSNTLTYYIKPLLYRLIEIYEDALGAFKPELLTIIIGLELLILFVVSLVFSRQKKEYGLVKAGKKDNNIQKLQKRYKDIQKEYMDFLNKKGSTQI